MSLNQYIGGSNIVKVNKYLKIWKSTVGRHPKDMMEHQYTTGLNIAQVNKYLMIWKSTVGKNPLDITEHQ